MPEPPQTPPEYTHKPLICDRGGCFHKSGPGLTPEQHLEREQNSVEGQQNTRGEYWEERKGVAEDSTVTYRTNTDAESGYADSYYGPGDGEDPTLEPMSDEHGLYHAPAPLAYLIPMLGAAFLILTFAFWTLSRRRSRRLALAQQEGRQALAQDLEVTGAGTHPRALSPSIPLPVSEPREHERGRVLLRLLRAPQFLRGYRRRGEFESGDPDWELDVDDAGVAPPPYTAPAPSSEKRQATAETDTLSTLSRASTLVGEDQNARPLSSPDVDSVAGRSEAPLPSYADVAAGEEWKDEMERRRSEAKLGNDRHAGEDAHSAGDFGNAETSDND